jgi:hypothetical protein
LSLKAEKRNTIYEVTNMLGISFGSVQIILKDDLNMGKILTKFMPHLLSEEQDNHVNTYHDN